VASEPAAPALAPTPSTAPAPTPAPAPAPTPTPTQPSAPDPTTAIQPPDTRGFIDALKQIHAQDVRAASARGIEARIERLFRADGMPPGLLRSVSCRQRSCRLLVRWTREHDAGYHTAIQRLIGENSKVLATEAGELDARGGVDVQVYWGIVEKNLPP
jgi:hypothetical protein